MNTATKKTTTLAATAALLTGTAPAALFAEASEAPPAAAAEVVAVVEEPLLHAARPSDRTATPLSAMTERRFLRGEAMTSPFAWCRRRHLRLWVSKINESASTSSLARVHDGSRGNDGATSGTLPSLPNMAAQWPMEVIQVTT